MATARLFAMHKRKGRSLLYSIKGRTDYAMDPEKTEKGELVTAYGCDPMTVEEEFLLQKSIYNQVTGNTQKRDVIAYQIIQSFMTGEITPEKANRLGYELAIRFTKGKYSFIVATHTDRDHVHNHIIFNSTAMDGTKKFRTFRDSDTALHRVNDMVCLENGVSVIILKPDSERKDQTEQHPVEPGYRMPELEQILKEKGEGYKNWAECHDFKQLSKSILYLKENNISIDGLKTVIKDKAARRDELLASLKEAEARMEKINEMKKYAINYSQNRKIYEKYRKSGYSSDFFEEYRAGLTLFKGAKEFFDRLEIKKIPEVKELSAEYSEIFTSRRQIYFEYRGARDEIRELILAEHYYSILSETGKKEKQNTMKMEER